MKSETTGSDFLRKLKITNPKRQAGECSWDALYPYYAGFPLSFAREILEQFAFTNDDIVWDPWNGSGTTTTVAAELGFRAAGFDLNPVMVVVARARLVSPLELNAMRAIQNQILEHASSPSFRVGQDDRLLDWFDFAAASEIRSIEAAIRQLLVDQTEKWSVSELAPIAASFYVALFASCRAISREARTSNPTWTKRFRSGQSRISCEKGVLTNIFRNSCKKLIYSLGNTKIDDKAVQSNYHEIRVGDACSESPFHGRANLVLTSPPYCTRIDYVIATSIEAAICDPLIQRDDTNLRRLIMGTTTVPKDPPATNDAWGPTCLAFLQQVASHRSHASATYYLKSHLDYFSKLYFSIKNISSSISDNGIVISVVQDSFYKEIHNDLPRIFSEMASSCQLRLADTREFHARQNMSQINSKSRAYRSSFVATEKVLVFERD